MKPRCPAGLPGLGIICALRPTRRSRFVKRAVRRRWLRESGASRAGKPATQGRRRQPSHPLFPRKSGSPRIRVFVQNSLALPAGLSPHGCASVRLGKHGQNYRASARRPSVDVTSALSALTRNCAGVSDRRAQQLWQGPHVSTKGREHVPSGDSGRGAVPARRVAAEPQHTPRSPNTSSLLAEAWLAKMAVQRSAHAIPPGAMYNPPPTPCPSLPPTPGAPPRARL